MRKSRQQWQQHGGGVPWQVRMSGAGAMENRLLCRGFELPPHCQPLLEVQFLLLPVVSIWSCNIFITKGLSKLRKILNSLCMDNFSK
jgi:hypothetical protein